MPGLGADALTVNPLLGADSLAPFVAAARARGAGLFVLVRTSNPGAADVQELTLADGGTVSDRLAAIVAELGAHRVGVAGLRDVGAVVGATAPERLEALRERCRTPPSCCPASARRGAGRGPGARRSRRAAPAGSSRPRAGSSGATSGQAAIRPPRPARGRAAARAGLEARELTPAVRRKRRFRGDAAV